ncbi:hypothetical protein C2G38_2140786, partial [Gigaspora rosea]
MVDLIDFGVVVGVLEEKISDEAYNSAERSEHDIIVTTYRNMCRDIKNQIAGRLSQEFRALEDRRRFLENKRSFLEDRLLQLCADNENLNKMINATKAWFTVIAWLDPNNKNIGDNIEAPLEVNDSLEILRHTSLAKRLLEWYL